MKPREATLFDFILAIGYLVGSIGVYILLVSLVAAFGWWIGRMLNAVLIFAGWLS